MANASSITGAPLTGAVATDPLLCRVSGYLKDSKGLPMAGAAIVLRSKQSPLGIYPTTMLGKERLTLKADINGYVEADLLRGATFSVELQGLLTWSYREIVVPPVASVDLIDLLFPYLLSLTFDDVGPVVLAVDAAYAIPMTGLLSNGATIPIKSSGVVAVSSNLNLTLVSGLTFRAAAVGTADVSIASVDAALQTANQTRDGVELVFQGTAAVVLPPSPLTFTITT